MLGGAHAYLPAHDGHLPAGNLVDALQLAFALVDQAGHILHGLVGGLYVVVITANRRLILVKHTRNSQMRTDKIMHSIPDVYTNGLDEMAFKQQPLFPFSCSPMNRLQSA